MDNHLPEYRTGGKSCVNQPMKLPKNSSQNIAAAVWDEADTSPIDTAQKASPSHALRRQRKPTGYCKQELSLLLQAIETFTGPDKRQITVCTMDNMPDERIA